MRHLLSLIFTQWLSLSTCIIQAAIDIVPSPAAAQSTRMPRLLYPGHREEFKIAKNKLEDDLYTANIGPNAFVAAYVSKMFALPAKDMPENKRRPLTAEEMRSRGREAQKARVSDMVQSSVPPTSLDSVVDPRLPPQEETGNTDSEVVLGFARLYSGTIHVGSSIYAVLPKYDAALGPTHPNNAKYVLTSDVEALYIMMGRELVPVEEVRAGNIFAIGGLASKVFRSATLCSPGIDVAGHVSGVDTPECLINLGAVTRFVRIILFVWSTLFILSSL